MCLNASTTVEISLWHNLEMEILTLKILLLLLKEALFLRRTLLHCEHRCFQRKILGVTTTHVIVQAQLHVGDV